MAEPDTFLTESRRAVLAGEYDGAENTERTHKSRIRTRSQSAIEELTEVAQSPRIDNRDVFDPEKIGTLLFYILRDPTGIGSEEIDGGVVKPSEETEQYRSAVLAQLMKQLAKFGEFEVGRFEEGAGSKDPSELLD